MGNIQKTIRYFKRNGIANTYYAVVERLFYKDVPFCGKDEEYDGPLFEDIKFSILVPVYETNEKHLREMIESCLSQVYGNFELILADASKSSEEVLNAESVENGEAMESADNGRLKASLPINIIREYAKKDDRVKYVRVKDNKGISENTNVAIDAATGDYCALLDHDDLLTPDALYEMLVAISKSKVHGVEPVMVYSNEDKCDGEATRFFDPHIKQKLNLDLLLSNNYICHFTCIKTETIKNLKFRGEYNGSQDYDMFLRVVALAKPEEILHIKKVLYHWRCHEASTSFNPASKEYAYAAGKRAIEDFVKRKCGVELTVSELSHKGFYKVEWGEDIFKIRPEVGATGSFVYGKNKITSGIINKDGSERFTGMNKHFSGYMHHADLQQDVYALDIRTITPAPSMKEVYDSLIEIYNNDPTDENAKLLGLRFGDELADKGLLLLYIPSGI